jgi:WS/DGAT/MGAT family acyltransferase
MWCRRVVIDDAQLAGEDAAWLHMDRPSNPMVITALLELDGPLSDASLHAIFEQRLLRFARFGDRVVEPILGAGAPTWQRDPDFTLPRHVVRHTLRSTDDVELRAAIDAVASTCLDRARPLWQMHLFDRPAAGTVVLVRIHHAVADGFALLRVLLAVCDGAAPDATAPTDHRTWPWLTAGLRGIGRRLAHPGIVLTDLGQGARWLKALGRLVLLLPDHHTVLRGGLGPTKRVAWSRAFALGPIKAAGQDEGATINDVLISAIAGGLRRYLLRTGDALRDVRAMIPVDLRQPNAPVRLGNRFGLVVLSLPLTTQTARARLREAKRRMDALKRSPEAHVGMAIVAAMGLAPRGLESLGVRFFSTKASAVLTNVPGPRAPLRLGGRTITRMLFWVPQSGDLALGLSIFSYADAVTIGVMADAERVPDPERLVGDIEAELAALLAP